MGNVRVAHYLASFHKNVIFVKTRHCFIYPPSVAEISFLRIPKMHLNMMYNLKSAKRILSCTVDKLFRLQIQVKMPELGTSVEADFISGRKLSGKLKPAHFVRVWFRKVGNAIKLEHS